VDKIEQLKYYSILQEKNPKLLFSSIQCFEPIYIGHRIKFSKPETYKYKCVSPTKKYCNTVFLKLT